MGARVDGSARGWLRALALTIGALTLGIGPWLGLPAASSPLLPASFGAPVPLVGEAPAEGQAEQLPPPLSAATGCSCREVVVDASNVVKDADIRTGDATVINRTITYIAPSYEDTDVEVEQEAEAITGDAIAGQVLAVNGGEGCSRVTINATNIVEDSEIRTGDAVAKNQSLILIDPSIRREDLEIEVDQEATARSGDAIAGQVIGVKGGGPCGGVIMKALNRVRNVDLRTGDAITKNLSEILACQSRGCIQDMKRMLAFVDSVDVCTSEGCEPVPTQDFIRMMREQANNPVPPEDEEADEDDEESDDEPRHGYENPLDNPRVREAQPWRYPQRTRPPNREPARTPEPTPTPTPSPTPEA